MWGPWGLWGPWGAVGAVAVVRTMGFGSTQGQWTETWRLQNTNCLPRA